MVPLGPGKEDRILYDIGVIRSSIMYRMRRMHREMLADPSTRSEEIRRRVLSPPNLLEEPLLGPGDRGWVDEVVGWFRARGRKDAELEVCEFRSGPGGWLGIAATDGSLAAQVRPSDFVVAGFGALRARDGGLSVWPRIYRRICSNGAILAVGAGEETDCDETTIRAAIDAALEPRSFEHATSMLRRSARTPILDPLDVLARARALTPARIVADRWARDGDPTAWGLVNIVTSSARWAATLPERFSLERDAGRILEVAMSRSPGDLIPG